MMREFYPIGARQRSVSKRGFQRILIIYEESLEIWRSLETGDSPREFPREMFLRENYCLELLLLVTFPGGNLKKEQFHPAEQKRGCLPSLHKTDLLVEHMREDISMT